MVEDAPVLLAVLTVQKRDGHQRVQHHIVWHPPAEYGDIHLGGQRQNRARAGPKSTLVCTLYTEGLPQVGQQQVQLLGSDPTRRMGVLLRPHSVELLEDQGVYDPGVLRASERGFRSFAREQRLSSESNSGSLVFSSLHASSFLGRRCQEQRVGKGTKKSDLSSSVSLEASIVIEMTRLYGLNQLDSEKVETYQEREVEKATKTSVHLS